MSSNQRFSAGAVAILAVLFGAAMGLMPGPAAMAEVNGLECGDVNDDARVNILDPSYLMHYLFRKGAAPEGAGRGDLDSINGITTNDIQFLCNYLFNSGPAPSSCAPYPDSTLSTRPDTVEIQGTRVPPGTDRARIDLWLTNVDSIDALTFPFHFRCPTSDLLCDSISLTGSLFASFDFREKVIDTVNDKGVVGFFHFLGAPVTPGSGLLASLWFSLTPSIDNQDIEITVVPFPPSNTLIFTQPYGPPSNYPRAFYPVVIGQPARTIQFTEPGQNALNAPISTDIEVGFGHAMDPATIMDTTFVVYGRSSGPHAGTITYNAPMQTATFDPTVDFQPGELVTVILSNGIDYQTGAAMDTAYIWSFTTAAHGGTGIFSAPVQYPTGAPVYSAVIADLNKDGDNDLAVANSSDNVSIFINNGDGTFQPAVDYGVGSDPRSVFAADLDRDGDQDLAVANYNDHNISILKNNGDGTFAAAVNYITGASPQSVFAADLDGDGDQDLAVAKHGSDSVSVLKNNGDGTFAAAVDYGVVHSPSSIYAADLDGDGDQDLAAANPGRVEVLKNNGDGTFAAAVYYSDVFVSLGPIIAADLDGDGDQDLVVGDYAFDSVFALKNNGNGTFAAAAGYATGVSLNPNSIFAADLDGDGDQDLAVAAGSDGVSFLKNNGDGTFASAVHDMGVDGYVSVFAADLDGDGDDDLAMANRYSNAVSILLNQGDFLVQNINNAGVGSLRWAIEQSNADVDRDTIVFATSGTIGLLSPLPPLTDSGTVILGSTASGGAHSVAVDGSAAGSGSGLAIQSPHNKVEGLTIRNFPGNGITVTGATSVYNTITNNLIYDNNGLGIDLGADGVTVNDIGDGDTGPNDLLNYPEIDSVRMNPDSSFVVYGRAADSAAIEFYIAHPVGQETKPADPSGHGEAYTYAGSDTAGIGSGFIFTVAKTAGQFSVVSATATDTLGNTSEFCQNFTLTPAPLVVVAYCPINIIVTDPDGRRFGKDSLGNDITDIPDGHYFVTPNDSVVIDHPIEGTYIVQFVTEAGIPAGATYSSIIKIDGTQQLIIAADKLCPASGKMDTTTYEVEEGYHYKNGDGNRDNTINVGDAVFVVNYIFKGGAAPDPYLSGDANCDRTVNIGDAVYVVNYIFKGGPKPCNF